jgi:hypothetical protein
MRANETRREIVRFAMASDVAVGVREAAKRGPSQQIEFPATGPAVRDPPASCLSDIAYYDAGERGLYGVAGTGQRKALAY